MTSVPADLQPAFIDLLRSIADDRLVLGHHGSDWTGLAPMLEEDIAFSSLAQDDIAHAQTLYERIGALTGCDADTEAFDRPADAYRCAALVEFPDEFDWALVIVRRFFMSVLDELRLDALARSSDPETAARGERMRREQTISSEHARGWIRRLGSSTDEARTRTQAAFDRLADEASMLTEPTDGQHAVAASGLLPLDPVQTGEAFRMTAERLAKEAGFRLSLAAHPESRRGGRRGVHTEHLAAVLEEMTQVRRAEPSASW